MAANTYQRVLDLSEEEAVSVGMNEVRFLNFIAEGKHFLLTAGLNGCFGVAIVSRTAAILGHIPHNPDTDRQDLSAGDRNVIARMRDIAAPLQAHQPFFAGKEDILVVSAIYAQEIALPEQKEIFETNLKQIGLEYTNIKYVAAMKRPRSEAHKTINIDGQGPRPSVYVADQLVLPK